MWWEWDPGSRLFHWHWSEFHQTIIRDSLKICEEDKVLVCHVPPRDTTNTIQKQAMTGKFSKMRMRGNIAKDDPLSLTTFFATSEGDDGIQMAFDGTQSRLNAAT
jgi:hypothetical protein